MIRLRFEKASQIFDGTETVILPLKEILQTPDILGKRDVMGEIPPVIWEGHIDTVRQQLAELKTLGLKDVVAENIGAINIAKDFGFRIHGGFTLNILNSIALEEYKKLGLESAVLTVELSFANVRKIKSCMPVGMITYGYLPMMKFRSCPLRTEKGCGKCNGSGVLTDRMGEKFTVICREKQYSELLNFVPVYVGDKSLPKLDFEELYFTVETSDECKSVYDTYMSKAVPGFERTAGLYFRELL